MFINGRNKCSKVEKIVHVTDSPVKKKFLAQLFMKKVMLNAFVDMKGPIIFDFVEKSALVNNSSDNRFLR